MNKKIGFTAIILILFLLCFSLFFLYGNDFLNNKIQPFQINNYSNNNNNNSNDNSNNNIYNKTQSFQIDVNEKLLYQSDGIKQIDHDDIFSVKALVDGSIIYLSNDFIKKNGGIQSAPSSADASYCRYYINDNQKTVLGKIDNFVLGTKHSALIDDKLYYYVCLSAKNMKMPYNALLCFNLTKDTVDIYNDEDKSSYCGISAYEFNGNVIALKNKRDEKRHISFLEVFDVKSKKTKQVIEHVLDTDLNTGSKILNLYSNGDKIYLLVDEFNGKTQYAYLRIYDRNLNMIKSIPIERTIRNQILNTGIQDFAVFENLIYTRDLSDYSFLGKIVGNRIEPLITGKSIDLALNHKSQNNPIFFERRTNKCYIGDIKNGTYTPIELKIGNDCSIRTIIADDENILIACSDTEKPEFVYYIKRDKLSNIYIPCE